MRPFIRKLCFFHPVNLVTLTAGIALCIYVAFKAANSSFTHDESFTWLHYVHDSFFDIFTYKKSFTNNHLLNSLGMKYSEMIFGNTEFALRLPNLLLLIVYLIAGFLLFKRENKLLALAFLFLLCTNNALIDLFGLARGYGLSIGFLLLSLYYFIESFYSRKTVHVLVFHATALLAILSSFTLVIFYIALLGISIIMLLAEWRIEGKKTFLLRSFTIYFLPFIPVFIILFEPVRRVIKFNNFDFGGKNGFFHDTIQSLVRTSFHNFGFSPILITILALIFVAIVLTSTAIITVRLMRRNVCFFNKYKALIISNLALLIMAGIIVLQHILLQTDYPVGRFALFFYPLFIVHLGLLISFLTERKIKKIPVIAIPLIAVTSFLFVSNANPYSCSEWGFDQNTKNMMLKLNEVHDKKQNKIKLGIDWIFEPAVNYYREKMKLNWLLPADRNGLSDTDDYDYIPTTFDSGRLPDSYEVIATYPTTDTWLLKMKK
ncbi:hypothetical protein BH11BAC7_BH11BAC7_08820 [soil metagenome]